MSGPVESAYRLATIESCLERTGVYTSYSLYFVSEIQEQEREMILIAVFTGGGLQN